MIQKSSSEKDIINIFTDYGVNIFKKICDEVVDTILGNRRDDVSEIEEMITNED
jgi:hypothetical protein